MNWLVMSFMMWIGTLHYAGEFTNPPLDVLLRTPTQNSYQTTLGVEMQGLDNHLFLGGQGRDLGDREHGRPFQPEPEPVRVQRRVPGIRVRVRMAARDATTSHSPNAQSAVTGFSSNRDDFYLSYHTSVKVF